MNGRPVTTLKTHGTPPAARRRGATTCGAGFAMVIAAGMAPAPAMAQGRDIVVMAPGSGGAASIDYARPKALPMPWQPKRRLRCVTCC